STDLRGHFGGLEGRALRDGDELPLAGNSDRAEILIEKLRKEKIARWSPAYDWFSTAKREPVLRIVRGVNWDRFNSSTHRALTSETFSVSPDSDRMGVRLDGPQMQ